MSTPRSSLRCWASRHSCFLCSAGWMAKCWMIKELPTLHSVINILWWSGFVFSVVLSVLSTLVVIVDARCDCRLLAAHHLWHTHTPLCYIHPAYVDGVSPVHRQYSTSMAQSVRSIDLVLVNIFDSICCLSIAVAVPSSPSDHLLPRRHKIAILLDCNLILIDIVALAG